MGEGKLGLLVGRGRLVIGQLGEGRTFSYCVGVVRVPEGWRTGEGKFGF